jgi:hypothetical protein
MYSDFFLLERDGAPVSRAERLALGDTSGRDEAWLRDTLFRNPAIVPVRDVDPSFGPLIPLCRELQTEAGRLDVAYINQYGRLTLVECKLWRNPEARRKVVAQVLDYARALSRWSYSDLQRQVSQATGRTGNVPFDLAKELIPELDERRFVDETAAAMRQGRFLLLIAGDGIREDIHAMTELINRNAASGFSFGLVEVALYGLEDGGLAVQPRVVTKTQIIQRNIVVLRDGDHQFLGGEFALEADLPRIGTSPSVAGNPLGESPKQAAYREWWKPVMDAPLDDPDQEPPKLFWPNHLRAALPVPNTWLLVYATNGGRGQLGVCTAGRAGADQPMLQMLEPDRDEILAELPAGSAYRMYDSGNGYTYSLTRSGDEFVDDDERRAWLAKTLNAFVNVFRPRINALGTEVLS